MVDSFVKILGALGPFIAMTAGPIIGAIILWRQTKLHDLVNSASEKLNILSEEKGHEAGIKEGVAQERAAPMVPAP